MRGVWTVARLDLAVWRRSPWALAVAVVPPLAMLFLVKILTLSVTQQPVALVVQGHGPASQRMASFIKEDDESYLLTVTSLADSKRLLKQQKVAATIVIPRGFDRAVARGHARLEYTLNNVSIDFSDDIRRSVDRSVAQFDAPHLGEGKANPYRVEINQTELRNTNVPFDVYQTMPVLLLLILNVGVLGSALLGSRDHERRTAGFLRLTPLGGWSFVAGRLLGSVLLTGAVLVPTVGWLAWRGSIHPPPGHWPALVALLAATAVLACGIGVLLGAVFKHAATVALATVIVSSYAFFLGGGFTTIAFLPDWLQLLSRAVPTRYAIDGLRQTLFYPDLRGVAASLAFVGAFAFAGLAGAVTALRVQARAA
jgi:ABC-2 type transport system permease protein